MHPSIASKIKIYRIAYFIHLYVYYLILCMHWPMAESEIVVTANTDRRRNVCNYTIARVTIVVQVLRPEK